MSPTLTKREVEALDRLCDFAEVHAPDDAALVDAVLTIDDLITRLGDDVPPEPGADADPGDVEAAVATVVYHA